MTHPPRNRRFTYPISSCSCHNCGTRPPPPSAAGNHPKYYKTPVTEIVLARPPPRCIQKWPAVRIALSNFSTHTRPTQHIPCVSVLAQLCDVSSVIPSSVEAISTTLTSTYCFTTNSLLTEFTTRRQWSVARPTLATTQLVMWTLLSARRSKNIHHCVHNTYNT